MNNKIVSTKRTSAIFLSIVLVTGTITAISPSFMIIGANAQAQPYYGEMDNSYDDKKSYGMDDSYGYSDYRDDKDKKYDDSYGPPVYGMDDNSYDKKPVYGMDNSYDDRQSYDKKSNGNDNSYKPQYTSYDKKDDRDKSSKDSKKSVSLNKFNCINTNLNINGNNTGNVSIGNKEQGYLGVSSSSGGSGYGGYDGYSKHGKGFDCVINNTNTNVNTVGGNVTDGDGAVEECVLCLLEANVTSPINVTIGIGNIVNLEALLDLDLDIGEQLELTIFDLCRLLEGLTPLLTDSQLRALIDFLGIEITAEAEVDLIDCLLEAGIIIEGM